MSIPVLIQTYDEVRRLAIAGSVVAPGDFRLKKLVAPLEQAGQKAPVFAKVAEAVNRLVESREQTSAAALLDLATLVNSILYTQGETGLAGELSPVPSTDLGLIRTQVSARVIGPLREALTTTGSGRLEVVRDGFEQGMFQDLRLIAPALGALDDVYTELAELVEQKILPLYGPAIVPELEKSFDPKGKSGHARRLRLMHALAPGTARPHVMRALDEGTPELRVAAISCLGESPDDIPFLLEQVKARAKPVRSAALVALSRSGEDRAALVLADSLTFDEIDFALPGLQASRHPIVTAALLDEAEARASALIATKEKDGKVLGRRNQRMYHLLDCLEGRQDARTEALLLSMFEQAGRIAAIKGSPGGGDVVERLVAAMAAGSPQLVATLIDAHATLSPENLGQAFLAACRVRDPAEVFAIFSPYLTAGDPKKKGSDPAWMKREAIIVQLHRLARRDPDGDVVEFQAKLDPRWRDLAVQTGDADLVYTLAEPGHAASIEFISQQFQHWITKAGKEYELSEVLDAMMRIHHPERTDAVIEVIRKLAGKRSGATYYWYFDEISTMIPNLPRDEVLPKLEALLPTLPEKIIDHLMKAVTQLKQGTHGETSP